MPTRDTVISQVRQPELVEGSRAQVVQFQEQYDEHIRTINTINADRTTSNRLRIPSIRECIKIDLLENLIMTGEIPDVSDIKDLTNE